MHRVLALPGRLFARVRRDGLGDTLRRVAFLLHTAWRERRLGIDSGGFIHWHELSSNPDSVDYEAVGYRTLDRVFRLLTIRPGEDVFVDYGCGKGRPLAYAATYAFKRVVGVELSAELCETARENLRRVRRRRCPHSLVVQTEAGSHALDDDATVLFFFNPFNGRTLETVMRRIQESLARRPRPLQLIYVYPKHVDDAFADCDWLRLQYDLPSEGLLVRLYRFTAAPACAGDRSPSLTPNSLSCT